MTRLVCSGMFLLALAGCAATPTGEGRTVDGQLAEISCGQCQLGMAEPEGCDLAVRLDGKNYFVDGAGIDDFGDAHADDGFCNAIRLARVSGTIDGERFHATAIELPPEAEE